MKRISTRRIGADADTPAKLRKLRWHSLIVDLYCQGYSHDEVRARASKQIGHRFTREYVTKAVMKAVDQWKTNAATAIETMKATELQKLNKLESTYWEGWERSIEAAKTITDRVKPADEGKSAKEKTTTTRKTAGDPRFLAGIQSCIDARIKLMALEGPQVAVQINNNNTGTESKSTTVIRRVVFRTRETVSAPQVIRGEEMTEIPEE